MPITANYGIGIYRPATSEAHVLVEPKFAKRDGTSIGVIAVHGHLANATVFSPAASGFGGVAWGLAESGMTVLSIDAGGGTPWADDDEMAAMDAAYSYLQSIGCKTPVGVIGWSMGGLASLNWIKRNKSKVRAAVVWAPATDIAYFHDTSAGKATYAPEIEADYGGAGSWAANIVGHSPIGEPVNYRGLPPIRIYQGDADTTVLPSQTQAFVSAVNDPNMVLHTVAGADHTTVGFAATGKDVAEFFYGRVAA